MALAEAGIHESLGGSVDVCSLCSNSLVIVFEILLLALQFAYDEL